MQRIAAELRALHFNFAFPSGALLTQLEFRNGQHSVCFTEDENFLYATHSVRTHQTQQLAIAKTGSACYVTPGCKVSPAYGVELFVRKLREIYEQ